MSTEIDLPWGKENPRRGTGTVAKGDSITKVAMEFIEEFPIDGKPFSVDAFDKWAHQKGLINVPFGAGKQSDVWLAHLQRRHRLRTQINKAGATSRMDIPFVIEAKAQTIWAVRSVQVSAFTADRMMARVNSLVKSRTKKLDYLMQSVDWASMPIHQQIFAERLYEDIGNFKALVDLSSGQLSTKFERLRQDLRKSVEKGDIKPRNGAIAALLNDSDDEGE